MKALKVMGTIDDRGNLALVVPVGCVSDSVTRQSLTLLCVTALPNAPYKLRLLFLIYLEISTKLRLEQFNLKLT